jgi:Leucine-rich repeat (LRR) protein
VNVDHFVKENGEHFFKATFNRDLTGITVEGDSVQSRRVRYMEVNLDVGKNDLRIASVYSTKLNQREEYRNWWNALTTEWRKALASKVVICDSINLSDIVYIGDSLILVSSMSAGTGSDSVHAFELDVPQSKTITSEMDVDTIYIDTKKVYTPISGILKLRELKLAGNSSIRSLNPVSEMSELINLDISNTLVIDLFPLRNLNQLKTLDISNTPVEDISPIRYNTSIEELNCSYTLIRDLSEIEGLYNLHQLDCSGNRISDFQFLLPMSKMQNLNCSETQLYELEIIGNLSEIEKLNISGTQVRKLEAISNLKKINYLNCENTTIQSLKPVSDCISLEVLKISYTWIEDITPLTGMKNLMRIYWDGENNMGAEKKKAAAINFMKVNPGTLVIFESEDLLNRWAVLEPAWKEIVKNATGLGDSPSKEELHSLLQIEEINIKDKKVTTIQPLSNLYNLKKVNISGVIVEDYAPIADALEVEELDLSGTSISNLEVLLNLDKLEILNIENTSIADLSPLYEKDNLKIVFADNSQIDDDEAFGLKAENPNCIVVYKTSQMNQWWQELPMAWKDFFSASFKLNSPPTKEQLHKILMRDELEIINKSNLNTLNPLEVMKGLTTLKLVELAINDIHVLSSLSKLESLECSQMPISDLTPLTSLSNLKYLNIKNTSVADLKPISSLNSMSELKISGTQVRSLKPLSSLVKLEKIELNNTQVKSVKPLMNLEQLTSVECYNTRITAKNIERFKENNPDCKVVYY